MREKVLKGLVAATAAAALVVPSVAQAAPPAASTAANTEQLVVPKINWGSCGAEPGLKPFQCATVEVPTDYDHPRGPTTTIALTRLPASDPAHRIGTLFTNPGGPGGPGVDFVQQVGQYAYTPQVRAQFDILGFDPRGVGKSDPATCFRTEAEEQAVLNTQPAFPYTRAEERAYTAWSVKVGLTCAATSGDKLAHMSTANVARDMDLLRQSVGDDKLSYVGYSYGTYLGATYAKLFPTKIRALVLDGTLNPPWYSGSDGDRRPVGVRFRQGDGAAAAFAQFKAECKKAGPDKCSLARLGDPSTVVENLFERLKTSPAVVTLPDGSTTTVTYQIAVAVGFENMYDPAGWSALADMYSQIAVRGKSKAMRLKAPAALVEWSKHKEEYSSLAQGMQPCIETPPTGRPLAYPAYADAADQAAPHFGRLRAWLGQPCEFVPIRDTDAFKGPWPNKVKEPVLVIGTRYDPATPYEATRPYSDLYPDARMLTIEGYGHTTLFKSTCADARITEYLTQLKAPADGSTCQQDRKPFDPGSAAKKLTQEVVVH
ncbi:alpha/beta hydrolase [Streptomyces sp. SID13031]|uniref:alpha/beta hydrolase n=1 Tax=Streptomyces sp. SID13031 TaxID=2706046 RepID=UPI0013CC3520|nr:alpha/beta hydrolase [Streptomyces sp. SID13031]NEA37021.1 alpha/beta hydrolase [Streptomyces sp. SID13031]